MAFGQDGQKYYDTKPVGENNTTVNYIDPTDLPEIDDEIKNGVVGNVEQGIASWIRNEMGRKHVREALARSVEYFSVLFNKQKAIIDSNIAKQNNVEQRQSKLERDFITRISNATVNSEVINARQSDVYGQFNVLDLRVENIEKIMANFVPSGFIVKINHNLNRNPTVTVKKYDWAIGTETNGFDTAPDGLFGGGAVETVPTNLVYSDGVVYVHMPLVYKQGGKFILQSDKELLLIDGTHTLNFEFDGGLTDGTITDEPTNNIPINHTAYAYSADGTDRFTTVYPNLNLLDGTKDFKPISASNSTPNQNAGLIFFTQYKTVADLFKAGDYVTISYDIEFLNTDLYINSENVFIAIQMFGGAWTQLSKIKAKNVDGKFYTNDVFNSSDYVENTTHKVKVSRTVQLTQDFITANAKVNTIQLVYNNIPVGATTKPTNLKIEQSKNLNSISTPWMPSASEVTTADWPSYFGQYTDFTKTDSTNPSDYNWRTIQR